MDAPRYLTKSRFKLALECPTKLYYTGKKDYPDRKMDDSFLQALAQGGYQVGELAKCYFPGGINIDELDHAVALAKTAELMQRENVVVFEAAFAFGNLFIRADIVKKQGNHLYLYEVKAKSFDPGNPKKPMFKDGAVVSKWEPYLYDVAFQKYVISNAHPDLKVIAYLMVANKAAVCEVDGLNQRFFIRKDPDSGRTRIEVTGNPAELVQDPPLLHTQPVDAYIAHLENGNPFVAGDPKTFPDWIHHFADHYDHDVRLQGPILSHCRDCEFQTIPGEDRAGFKNGFKECWQREKEFTAEMFGQPSILHLWDYRKKDEYIAKAIYFQSQMTRTDLEKELTVTAADEPLSRVDRQEMQLNKSKANDSNPFVHLKGLAKAFAELVYPLHFIDFETTTVAIPFHKGRRPYEQIAFQFSHHVVNMDGTIRHQGEWINTTPGAFPNFEFVRQLKKQLEQDKGSIFRYAAHENTVLLAIYRQLQESSEPDQEELCAWIQTITKLKDGNKTVWEGPRNMIDLRDWVLKYYFAPETLGSNSIKAILPAMLNNSVFLKEKYGRPIYGGSGIPSHNFRDKQWVVLDEDGSVINPYKQLEPIFEGIDEDMLDVLVTDDDAELRDGGAAMIAYVQMQFTRMSEAERELIKKSLLKYCELDTLAMVMIWEGWKAML